MIFLGATRSLGIPPDCCSCCGGSYYLVSYHQNLMKLVLNYSMSHCLPFPGIIFHFLKSDFSALVDFEQFQPWYLSSELWNPISSLFMHVKFALTDKVKGFQWFTGDKFLNFILFSQKLDLGVLVDLEKFKPWYLRSEHRSSKNSSVMHGLSWNLL